MQEGDNNLTDNDLLWLFQNCNKISKAVSSLGCINLNIVIVVQIFKQKLTFVCTNVLMCSELRSTYGQFMFLI